MTRSRMFGGDDPGDDATPSPRTTIVGAQPLDEKRDLPPVPTGMQRLLRLASVDEAFQRELLARRADVAVAAGVELTPSEAAILRAVPAAQLTAMIGGLPAPPADRRAFLRQTAAAALVVLSTGVVAAACGGDKKEPVPARSDKKPMDTEGGAAPDEPPPNRYDHRMQAPGGAAPDVPHPPPPPPPADAGVAEAPPPAEHPAVGGGARPEVPPDRPAKPNATRGIRRDVPPKPDF